MIILKGTELNFELTLKSIRKSLSCWQWRNLTLVGKIQLFKTFAMPQFMLIVIDSYWPTDEKLMIT